MLRGRKLSRVLGAPFEPRHYRALLNMARLSPQFRLLLRAYLFGDANFPLTTAVRTPLGRVEIKLFCPDDALTLNEVFFREDYRAPRDIRVAVDVGSNIGISALYFLTRNRECRCYCFEPDDRNLVKLQENLRPFACRYEVSDCAVSDVSGIVDFGIERTGRYGGIGVGGTRTIRVASRHVNEVVAEVLAREGKIDVLKFDTEGREEETVTAIDRAHLPRIRTIYFESEKEGSPIHPDLFEQRRRGHVERLVAVRHD
jgi:FkbM family methyltransferase